MSLTDWKTTLSKIGNLALLTTTKKNTLVEAINELKSSLPVSGTITSFLPRVIDTKAAIANLATEAVLVSLPIPINTPLGTVINFCIWGRFFNSHTASVNFRLRAKLFATGGLTILDTGNLTVAPIAVGQWRRWKMEGKFILTAGSHRVLTDFEMGAATGEATTILSKSSDNILYLHQFAAWDFTVLSELQFTALMGIALPNVTVQFEGAIFD
jgi:hypothetical protein